MTQNRDKATSGGCDDGAKGLDVVRVLTPIVRAADEQFMAEGGSTRHWVRDYFLPRLAEAGLVVQSASAEGGPS